MKKKLILFDWGNIVEAHTTGYSCYDAFDDLFKECGYQGTDLMKELKKYRITRIKDDKEFKETYKLMKEELKLNKSYSEFSTLYKKIFSKIDYYKDVADYEVSLKDRCAIGIFSNLTIFDKERLEKQVDLPKYDYVLLSYEYGMRKPELELFEEVQKKLPFNKEDILFIDDKKENIESAKEFGWNTFQATGLELDMIKEKIDEFI